MKNIYGVVNGERESVVMSLKKVYESYFKIGTSVSERNLFSADAKQEILKHYSSITAENGMKPMYLLDGKANIAEPEKYNLSPAVCFDSARKYLEFAKENNILLRGHTLVWHNQTPDWFFRKDYSTDKEAPLAGREVMLARLEGYIRGVLTFVQTEYPGVIYAWDVVNEVIEESEENGWRKSLWYRTVGEDFVLQAFRMARKYAHKDVKLFYNDYCTFVPKKRNRIKELILEPLIDENLIDGMGMQSHLVLKYNELTEYEKSLKTFGDLGLEIHITELDIHNPDSSEQGQQDLMEAYKQLFQLLVKAKKNAGVNVTSVTFWGMKDDESWLTGFRKEKSYPLLFGENYELKQAYYAVIDVLNHV